MKRLLGMLIVALALAVPQAQAGVIGTEQALQAPSERERVKAMLERPEVARELQKLGINARDAAARVDAMSNEEVAQLAGRLDALPAGGVLSNQDLVIILLVVIIVLLLV
ncbi:MAG: hypothetical protein E6H63_09565 [Betaproteobacteria bacterium]|nr:MAG: hypothetical protein E6H63_09565 [Betaproteobacteria bacterium]